MAVWAEVCGSNHAAWLISGTPGGWKAAAVAAGLSDPWYSSVNARGMCWSPA
jgi:hypothetical protein